MSEIGEIVLVDKPKGISSFGALGLLRKMLGLERKVKLGHAGTLDPNATGLLVVGVGKATKRIKEYVGLPKTYEAEIILGIRTDTGDVTGQIEEREEIKDKSKEEIMSAVEEMVGKRVLPVPKYSATKQGGEALYKKVRAGKKFVLPKREMEVFKSQITNIKHQKEKVFVYVVLEVSSGTYIRSIAEEVGKRLNVSATLGDLRRTKVGDMNVEEAIKLNK